MLSELWKKFRSRAYRHAFVEAHLKRGVPTQIRAMRLNRGWTQKELAENCGLEQGTISRIENPDYGRLSFETVLAVARGFDCAFVGRFVPFSHLRSLVEDTTEETTDLAPTFDEEDRAGLGERRTLLARGREYQIDKAPVFAKTPPLDKLAASI